MSEIIYRDPPRRPKWILPAVVAGGALALFLGVALVGVCLGVYEVGVPVEGVHSGGPQTDDERTVAARILGKSEDVHRIEWAEWGPNDTTGLTHFADPSHRHIIRVAGYNNSKGIPKTYFDLLYIIDPDPPKPSSVRRDGINRVALPDLPTDNRYGRGWLKEGIREKAEQARNALLPPR